MTESPVSRRDCLLAPLALAPLFASAAQPAAAPRRMQWPARTALLDGRVLTAADWADRPALLVIWATHCPFCVRHNVLVQRLQQSLGSELRILGLSLDSNPTDVQRYMSKNGYSFAVTLDSAAWLAALSVRKVLPTTIPIGRDGRIGQVVPGEMFEEDLQSLAHWALRPIQAPG